MMKTKAVLVILCAATSCASSSPASIFSDADINECTRIRGPELVKSGDSYWHVFATCCGSTACGHATRRRLAGNSTLGDDHRLSRVIMATSSDKGMTWGKAKFLADGQKGYEGVNAIYDKIKKRVVVQYQKLDGQKTDGGKTYQTMSSDHCHTWSKPVDLSKQLKGCVVGETAGPRVQTGTGRLLWYSGTHSCVWYSDDHGETYNTSVAHATASGSERPLLKNEVSFSVVGESNSSVIYANGRGIFTKWQPYRIDYVSKDDGLTWKATKSALKDPPSPDGGINNEERALLYAGGAIYTAEPKGTKDGSLRELIVSCSKDNGKSWPKSVNVNGAHYAGYSNLGWVSPGKDQVKKLLVVWDHEKDDVHTVGGTILSQVIGANWC